MASSPSAPKRPGKREVRKLLSALSKEALIDELMRMYDDFAPVREYLSMRVSPDDTAVREKYRRIIEKEFSFSWTRTPRVSVARKAVQDYRKVAASVEGIADVMLYYVEQAVAFADGVGVDDPAIYRSAWLVYQDALEHIARHELKDQFVERSARLVAGSHGYGFSDVVGALHDECFDMEYPDDEMEGLDGGS